MTREEGKTLPEAKGEVRRAINIFRYFAGEGARLPGMLVPSRARPRPHVRLRKPIGVVGLITPWNFPSAIPAWKLAPALICGNTVVMKPASAAPLSAWRIVEALPRSGHPERRGEFRGRARAASWARRWSTPRRSRPFPSPAPARSATGCTRGLQAAPADPARNGRQEPDHRAGRRGFQLRRRERRERGVLFDRPEVHGHQPRHCRRADLRPLRRRAGGAHAEAESRQRHAARHRHRPVRRPGADGDRAALHRDRPQGMRASRCAAAAG